MAKAQLAFYIAENGNIVDKLIAWYTDSKYSHVELVYDGLWYSTSPRDLKVRRKRIEPTEGHWDYLDVEIDETYVGEFFFITSGKKYDWLGILLSQFLPLNKHNREKWFCSEWCAFALKIKESHRYSPEDLHNRIVAFEGI